jgi:hypothetical protein
MGLMVRYCTWYVSVRRASYDVILWDARAFAMPGINNAYRYDEYAMDGWHIDMHTEA